MCLMQGGTYGSEETGLSESDKDTRVWWIAMVGQLKPYLWGRGSGLGRHETAPDSGGHPGVCLSPAQLESVFLEASFSKAP